MESRRVLENKGATGRFRVKQRLEVVFTVEADSEHEAARLLKQQLESAVVVEQPSFAVESLRTECEVKRLEEVRHV